MADRRTRRPPAPRRTAAAAAALAVALLAGACASAPPADTAVPGSAAGSTAAPRSAPAAGTSAPKGPTGTNRPTGTTRGTAVEPTAKDTDFPQLGTPGLDVTHYDLDLDYDVGQKSLQATARLDALVTAPTSTVSLDFQGLDVDAVRVGDRDATFSTRKAKLQIDLPEDAAVDTALTISVRYHGTPKPVATDALGGVEVGWHAAADGSFVLSEPEGASTWFPVNNHPRDKATYTFAVTVPKPYVAIANGRLDRTDDHDAGRTFHWVMDAPMANYLATVVTGSFDEQELGTHDAVTYSNWVPASGPSDGETFAPDQPEVIAGLEEWLGPFPFTTYGAVIYPTSFIQGSSATRQFLSGVALECQGRSLYSERAARGQTVTHETTHQWMGDSVSIEDWGKDIWWVEGFATFAESLRSPDRIQVFRKAYASTVDQWVPPGALSVDELFGSAAYTEGSVVFYALEREVGQETFKRIMRTFTERYRHANASTQELIAVASEVSGQDLQPFFDGWLFAETPPPFPK